MYLDGAQVTKDILRALPAVPVAVCGLDPETLAELESEMAAIQVDVDAAAARAARRSNAIVFGGLVLLCAQLATFVRLTCVELSWDVMEPISYFVGVFNAILLYVYFMVNQRDFSFDDWSKRMRAHFRRQNIERARVDAARYAALARRLGKKEAGDAKKSIGERVFVEVDVFDDMASVSAQPSQFPRHRACSFRSSSVSSCPSLHSRSTRRVSGSRRLASTREPVAHGASAEATWHARRSFFERRFRVRTRLPRRTCPRARPRSSRSPPRP